MTAGLCLIDTDILSYILKDIEPVCSHCRKYIKDKGRFTISALTYYECIRGYHAVGATKRLEVFKSLLDITDVIYPNQEIFEKAAELYGVLRKKGILPGEFDILIAATAIVGGFILVTNNEKHYKSISNYFPLKIKNWMKS